MPGGDRRSAEAVLALHGAPGSGLVVTARRQLEALRPASGLEGALWELAAHARGRALLRLVVILQDARYGYNLHLDSLPGRAAENRARLLEVAASVRPVPAPQGRGRPSEAALDHWIR